METKKFIIGLAIIIALLITIGSALAVEESVLTVSDIKVGKTGGTLVSYAGGGATAAFQPGDEITVKATVKNNGNVPLETIEVAVNADPALGNFPAPQNIPDPFHLQAGQEKEVTYAYKIPASLTAGSYSVEFAVKARDESVPYNEYVSTRNFLLKVEQKQNNVYVDSLALYVNDVKDDNSLTCQEKLKNVEVRAKLVDIGFEPETKVKVTLTNNALGLNLDKTTTIKGESSPAISFSLDPKKITGEHQLTLKVYRAAQFPVKLYDTETLTVTGQDCTVTVSSALPSSTSLTLKEDKSQDFSITLQNPANVAVSYQWFVEGQPVPGEVAESFVFNANNKVGDHTVKVTVTGQNVNLNKEWAVKVADRPVDADKFPGTETTKLKDVQDVKKVPNFTLENNFGKIKFTQDVDLSEILFLAEVVSISDGKVTVKAPELSKPATITLKKTFQKPLMLKDSKKCPQDDCKLVGNANGQFVFTVLGFSTYEVVEELPADFSISDIVFTDVKQGDSGLLKTVTLKNAGTFESLTDVKVELVEVDEDYKNNNLVISEGLSTDEQELSAQEQASVTLKINVPNDAKTDVIAKLRVSGKNQNGNPVVKEANVKVQLKSFLKVLNVEVNGDDDGELSLSDTNKVKFDLKNEHTKDMKADSIKVTVTLLDGKDEEVASEDLDLPDELADGEDVEVTVELNLKNDNLDQDKYTLEITVEGKDTDSNTHKTTYTQTVKVDRSDEEVAITRADLTNSKLLCVSKTTLHVTLKNNGDEDFNNLVLKVRNSALNLELIKSNIDLGDYKSSDNEYEASFDLDLTDAAADTYPLTVEVVDDDKVLDSEEVQLEVKECVSESTAAGTKEYYADEKLTAELQQKLAERESADQSVVKASFRESDQYVLMLGALVALMSIAALLSMVVMLVKRK